MPTSSSSKRSVRIHLEKNALPGYNLSTKRRDRREILDKLVKKLGWSNVVKKLNVLYIYNMNRYPINAAKFRRDMYYIQKTHSPSHKTSAKSYSRKKSKKRSVKRSRKSKKSKRVRKSKKSKRVRKSKKSKRVRKSKKSKRVRKSKKSKRVRKSKKRSVKRSKKQSTKRQ